MSDHSHSSSNSSVNRNASTPRVVHNLYPHVNTNTSYASSSHPQQQQHASPANHGRTDFGANYGAAPAPSTRHYGQRHGYPPAAPSTSEVNQIPSPAPAPAPAPVSNAHEGYDKQLPGRFNQLNVEDDVEEDEGFFSGKHYKGTLLPDDKEQHIQKSNSSVHSSHVGTPALVSLSQGLGHDQSLFHGRHSPGNAATPNFPQHVNNEPNGYAPPHIDGFVQSPGPPLPSSQPFAPSRRQPQQPQGKLQMQVPAQPHPQPARPQPQPQPQPPPNDRFNDKFNSPQHVQTNDVDADDYFQKSGVHTVVSEKHQAQSTHNAVQPAHQNVSKLQPSRPHKQPVQTSSKHVHVPVSALPPQGQVPIEIQQILPYLTEKVDNLHIHVYYNGPDAQPLTSATTLSFQQQQSISGPPDAELESVNFPPSIGPPNGLDRVTAGELSHPGSSSVHPHPYQMNGASPPYRPNGLEASLTFDFREPSEPLRYASFSEQFLEHLKRRRLSNKTMEESVRRMNQGRNRRRPVRRALLIGIEYKGKTIQINGCGNDVKLLYYLLKEKFQYQDYEIVVLSDVDVGLQNVISANATRHEILHALHLLVFNTHPGDLMFLSYSGHGEQFKDVSGDERFDGKDEALIPVDYDKAKQNHILDDQLYSIVKTICKGSRLTSLIDSCHSGSMLDLPYMQEMLKSTSGEFHSKKQRPFHFYHGYQYVQNDARSPDLPLGKYQNGLFKTTVSNISQELRMHLKEQSPSSDAMEKIRLISIDRSDPLPNDNGGLVIQFAGCSDEQRAEATLYWDDVNSAPFKCGAMTIAFRNSIYSPQMLRLPLSHAPVLPHKVLTYRQLLKEILASLRSRGKTQMPLLSSSHMIDLDETLVI